MENLSEKDKARITEELELLFKESIVPYRKDKENLLDKQKMLLKGIAIALLTNFIIAFAFQFKGFQYSWIFFAKLLIFEIVLLSLLFLVLTTFADMSQLKEDISRMKKVENLNYKNLITNLEKDKKIDIKKFIENILYASKIQKRKAMLENY